MPGDGRKDFTQHIKGKGVDAEYLEESCPVTLRHVARADGAGREVPVKQKGKQCEEDGCGAACDEHEGG